MRLLLAVTVPAVTRLRSRAVVVTLVLPATIVLVSVMTPAPLARLMGPPVVPARVPVLGLVRVGAAARVAGLVPPPVVPARLPVKVLLRMIGLAVILTKLMAPPARTVELPLSVLLSMVAVSVPRYIPPLWLPERFPLTV